MAKHEDVIKVWLGKRVQETASLGYQCVAWVKRYVLDRFGIKQ